MRTRFRSTLIAAFVLALSWSAVAGNVHVVDVAGTGFTDIQPAVDASADGDIILVKSGTYSAFSVVGRKVAVVADSGATVSISGTVRVRTCTQPVVLAGLSITGLPATPTSTEAARNALTASFNTGAVRVQHCDLTGYQIPTGCNNALHAALVQDCDNVAFVHSTLTAANTGCVGCNSDDLGGGSGLVARRSSVALYDSELRGALALCSSFGYVGGSGGPAFLAEDSLGFASHSTFRGGNGRGASCGDGGDGGHGLGADGATANVKLLDCDSLGGMPGNGNSPYQCPCPSFSCTSYSGGNPGHPTHVRDGATIQTLAEIRRSLDGPDVARESTTVTLTCIGQPGDFVWLAIGRTAPFVVDTASNGVVLAAAAGNPPRYLILGTVPANGQLQYTLALPLLAPGVQADVWHMQTTHESTTGTRHLGGALSLVVLDSAF